MAKVLDSISLDAPAAPVTADVSDTFAFTGTPGVTGSGGQQRFDFKWEVDDGGGFVTIAASGTGLITADTNPIVNTNSAAQKSITVTCDEAGSYTVRMAGAPVSGGSYSVLSATQTVEVSAPPAAEHATTGVLVGSGSAVAGTASSATTRPSSGALTGPGATLDGAAARTREHATDGVLVGQGSAVAGSADRQDGVGGVTHATSGALAGPGAAVAGSASSATVRASSGALAAAGATVAGAAARTRVHATSGVLAALGAAIAGAAEREGAPVTHATSGELFGAGASANGAAAGSGAAGLPDNPTTHSIMLPRDVEDDRDFEMLARVAELEADLEDIGRFIDDVEAQGDEFVDVFNHDSFGDSGLTGRGLRGR